MSSLKRVFDVSFCLLAAPMVVPLLACAALWIKLDSTGPVFFRQIRIGRDRKPFEILKLRTMIDRRAGEIDQLNEKLVTAVADQRITRAGKALRATSLDELPQIWNVLKGDMGWVGPRPLLPEQLLAIPDEYMARFDVRPGITGLAQVRGRRSLGWLEQLQADTEYACQANVLLDLKVMAQTVKVILTREGLYSGEAPNWRAYVRRQD